MSLSILLIPVITKPIGYTIGNIYIDHLKFTHLQLLRPVNYAPPCRLPNYVKFKLPRLCVKISSLIWPVHSKRIQLFSFWDYLSCSYFHTFQGQFCTLVQIPSSQDHPLVSVWNSTFKISTMPSLYLYIILYLAFTYMYSICIVYIAPHLYVNMLFHFSGFPYSFVF